jgi:phospholipid transport system substrate-binding protein
MSVMMKSPHNLLALILGFCVAIAVSAEELAPDVLVKKLTHDVLEAIQQDRELRAGNREKVLALAEEKILPQVDFVRMTRLAVGRAWRTATPAQREILVGEFRNLLVRTYSSAIRAYAGQTLVVEPMRIEEGATDARVRSNYIKPGAPPVPVEYAMGRTSEGWRVYDIVVDGVSLVMTYRTSFNEEIQRSGIDGLIARLREKSQQIGSNSFS